MVWTSCAHARQRATEAALLHELTEGHRPTGRPKLRYKETLNKSLKKYDIDCKQWETMSTSRPGWRHAIRKRTEAYENERQSSQQVNGHKRLNSHYAPETEAGILTNLLLWSRRLNHRACSTKLQEKMCGLSALP